MSAKEGSCQPPKYDVILLGATGYTGALTARYIFQNYPVDIKWAIAGRNSSKLAKLATLLEESATPKANRPGMCTGLTWIIALTMTSNRDDGLHIRVAGRACEKHAPNHIYSGAVSSAWLTPIPSMCREWHTLRGLVSRIIFLHIISMTGF
jgi:hypothetical protein